VELSGPAPGADFSKTLSQPQVPPQQRPLPPQPPPQQLPVTVQRQPEQIPVMSQNAKNTKYVQDKKSWEECEIMLQKGRFVEARNKYQSVWTPQALPVSHAQAASVMTGFAAPHDNSQHIVDTSTRPLPPLGFSVNPNP